MNRVQIYGVLSNVIKYDFKLYQGYTNSYVEHYLIRVKV